MPAGLPGSLCFGQVDHLAFPCPALGCCRPRLHGRLMRHAVKPVADHLSLPDRPCLTNEDEEGRLKGILGVVVVAKDTATDTPDHRSVPPHKRFNSGIV